MSEDEDTHASKIFGKLTFAFKNTTSVDAGFTTPNCVLNYLGASQQWKWLISFRDLSTRPVFQSEITVFEMSF
jgi:hypothetical protein